VPITVVADGVAASFVGEDAPVPVAAVSMTDSSQVPNKISIILPFSKDLAKASDDRGAVLLERDGSRALAVGEDAALLSSDAAVTGERPAGLHFGLTSFEASGGDTEGDVLALLGSVRQGAAVSPVFITSPQGALSLAGTREGTGGNRVFPNVTARGGDILGVPLLVSTGSPNYLTLLDADALLVTEGGIDITASNIASIQMDSAPSAGAQQLVSMFQTNCIALRLQRWISWRLAYADAAGFIELPIGSPA
jgi:hypothetical protein